MVLKKFDTYSLVFLTAFLLGGVFFRIYNYPIVKLFVSLMVMSFCLYFFSKRNYLNFFKFSILVLFLGHDVNQYILVVMSLLMFNKKIFPPSIGPIKYMYLFLIFCLISYILNQIIEVNILSLFFFVASFVFPIIFYFLASKYVSYFEKENIINYYIKIVMILDVVAMLQFFILGSTVDQLTGGVPSAHTLGFHSAVAFLYLFSKAIFRNKGAIDFKIHEVLLLFLVLPVLYFSDAKYVLGNMFFSLTFVYLFLVSRSIFKPFIIFIFFFLITFGFQSVRNSNIIMSTKSSIDVSYVTQRFIEGAKFQLLIKTFELPKNEPFNFFIGSGPGTFLSRAANSRAYDTMEKSSSLGQAESVEVESKLPSFIPPKTSWITTKYAVEYFNNIWYGTLFDYRSSLISLFWEVGLIGFTFFICFFVFLFKELTRMFRYSFLFRKNVFFINSFIVFFLLNAFLAYYFEYPKMQIIFWMFCGMFSNNDFSSFSFSNTKSSMK